MRAARECAAMAREMMRIALDEGVRRPVGLTESREVAFIIALTMEAAGSQTSDTHETG